MKKVLCLIGLCVFLFYGCKGGAKAPESTGETTKTFVPPKDGKVTKEMAEKYVIASRYLMEGIKRHEKDIDEFTKKYKVKSDLSELSDSVFMKKHPEVMAAWDSLALKWKNEEKRAYDSAGISEEEFNWIGGAITEPANQDVQKEIAAKIQEIIGE